MKINWIEFIVESHNLAGIASPFLKDSASEPVLETIKTLNPNEFTDNNIQNLTQGESED